MNDAEKVKVLTTTFHLIKPVLSAEMWKLVEEALAATAEPSLIDALREHNTIERLSNLDAEPSSAAEAFQAALDADYAEQMTAKEQATPVDPDENERVYREMWVYGNIALPTREGFKALGISEAYARAMFLREVDDTFSASRTPVEISRLAENPIK